MSDEQLVADPATEEVVVSEQPEQTTPAAESEPPKVEDGGDDAAAEEKTRSQLRREQRKAAEQRAREEKAALARQLADATAQLERVKSAGEAVKKAMNVDPEDPFAEIKLANVEAVSRMREIETQGQIDVLAQAQQQAEAARRQAVMVGFLEEVPAVKQRYPDFDQVAQAAAQAVSPELSWMVVESDQAHELTYHLGKNPALARTLSAMPPIEAARQLGRIEAALAQSKPVTNAPAPITPNKGSAAPTRDPSKMNPDEYNAWRAAGGTF